MTFLFTDIEGSTRRWEADAAAMRGALSTHDEALRNAIEEHGGWLFKHTGDGVIAAFASPRSAIDAAVAAQRALDLPVRMGIATGEAELRGDDYFGVVLNRAARVMASGHGGQILVADSTASLLSGVDLLDLGPHRLRDLAAPVGVFQIQAEGLPAKYPPLRALDKPPGNFRPAATSLIGREFELVEITGALHDHRLVTLTGVGGVGKTRLALEVGNLKKYEFPDGVWFFELAAVTDPAAVPDVVAAVLGVTQQPGKSLTASLADALEGRVRLLVFDNCEHVLDAAAELIEEILRHSTTVKILATSREGLGVTNEQLWTVPSLDVATATESSAVTLFIERARNVAQHFSISKADEAAAVVEICRRLDGIPLAIELAASRMVSMTAVEVRDRLDQRFKLLVGSRRGLERHQTLRHTVAWSYDHLDDAESALLERCSVFAGGFDLESACAVAGLDDLGEFAVLDLLDALVRKSLVVADRTSGRTRYSMLETIRQFADEQLVAGGAASVARMAHAHHFAGIEADILALWDSPRQREAYDWFAVELANLRTAFRWAADNDGPRDLDVAVTIATYATILGYGVGQYEPIAWSEELIGPASAVDHPRLVDLYANASQCWMSGRIEEGVRYSEAGQAIVGSGRGNVSYGKDVWLGSAYLAAGQPERCVQWCGAQLAHGRDIRAMTRSGLVLGLILAGRGEEAMAATVGLIDAAEATRNPWALSLALFAKGYAFSYTDPGTALDALRRGLTIAQDSGNRSNEGHLAAALCRVEAEHGDPLAAMDYFELAIRNYYDSGGTAIVLNPLAGLAAFLDRHARYESAATIAGFAVGPFTTASVPELTTAIVHLREFLGEAVYESLAGRGESMTTAEMVKYAYDQIDLARAEVSGHE